MDRREFLRTAGIAAAGVTLAGCDPDLLNIFNRGEEQLWGMNVHPFGGALFDAQVETLRRLGIRRVRMTLGLNNDLAGPYLRAYRAEYVGLLDHFNADIPDPATWTALVRRAVQRAPGLFCYEVLNEPMSLPPRVYVERYLQPAYEAIKLLNPSYQVAAAAPKGTADGRAYFYQMSEAGADRWCDFRAAHLYVDNPEVYLKGTDRPFLITESGVEDPAQHVSWWSKSMTHISGVLETERLYFYALATTPDTGWSVISSRSQGGRVVVRSPLHDYIKNKYGP
ncbi:MAG TPA: twin-arginine translocation signal domain-containing protein [Candidatus Methanoperedens sp.]|nr:twin-arginine translocation signal domain-containing protein [Candidatus Methanoperedens sp.]